jgi:TetR/AcrR family transcriptional regulator, transcriptional repressor for nem operon
MSRNDKRERLVSAANELFYQQTFNSSTLADIANKADVPLGNVYYYFKTKEDILKAVLQMKVNELQSLFVQLETNSNIKDRLRSFIHYATDDSEMKARFGCAIGSLCQELGKQTQQMTNLASDLMHKMVGWVQTQFKALGKENNANELAEYLVAGLQGGALVSLSFKDPSYLKRQGESLEAWLEKQ